MRFNWYCHVAHECSTEASPGNSDHAIPVREQPILSLETRSNDGINTDILHTKLIIGDSHHKKITFRVTFFKGLIMLNGNLTLALSQFQMQKTTLDFDFVVYL